MVTAMPWLMNPLAVGASVGASARHLCSASHAPVEATLMHGVSVHVQSGALLQHMQRAQMATLALTPFLRHVLVTRQSSVATC